MNTGSGTTHTVLTACSDAHEQVCTLLGEVLCRYAMGLAR